LRQEPVLEISVKADLIQLLNSAEGVTAIEYALLGALVAAVIAGAVGMLGASVLSLYLEIATKVSLAIH
jgi:pilus assembly protein Flp/PilA